MKRNQYLDGILGKKAEKEGEIVILCESKKICEA